MLPPWATTQKGRQLINGRTKGAQFERKIAKELFLELGLTFKRNLEQYRAGNHGDLTCDNAAFPWTIECKRSAAACACSIQPTRQPVPLAYRLHSIVHGKAALSQVRSP